MDLRKVAIRVLFASLAIAATAGVATLVVTPSNGDIIARLVWTAITTAIAATLLLVSITCMESTTKRQLGITLGLLVCGIYTCIVLAIWTEALGGRFILGNSLSRRFWYSSLVLALCFTPLLLGSGVQAYARLRIAGRVFLSIWWLLAIVWLVEIWATGDIFSRASERIVIPIMIASPIAAANLIRWPSPLTIFGLILVLFGCLLMQFMGLHMQDHWGTYEMMIALLCGWGSTMIGVSYILTLRHQDAAWVWAERATLILVAFSLGWLCYVIFGFENFRYLPEYVMRVTTASTILATTAMVGVVIRQSLTTAIFASHTSAPLHATCPRCTHALQLPQGKSRCPQCNLGIKIHFESTGCRQCGYDLSGLEPMAQCPECGTSITYTAQSVVG